MRMSAKAWFEAQRRAADIARHFVGLTTNVAAAKAFGITTTFGFWDWVGGRYSVWSAIGLPLAIAIGAAGFPRISGRCARHGRAFPHARRWSATCRCAWACWTSGTATSMASPAAASRPYHSALRRFPAYLQQLEMESNGKRVDLARPAAAVRHLARAVGRAGHQRPARLFPDAAPGHGRGAGRVRRREEGPTRPARPPHPCCWPTRWRRRRR